MKAKTIKAVITKKINEWAESIDDEAVRDLIQKNTIVTGGCIASMLLKENVNDYDIYFRTKEAAIKVAHYYVGKFQKSHEEKFGDGSLTVSDEDDRVRIVKNGSENARGVTAGERAQLDDLGETEEQNESIQDGDTGEATGKYRPVFISTNAITLSDKIQVVLRFFGEPDQIHENYDFIHATNYYQSWDGGKLVLKQEALESLLSKELRYVGSKYPICSMFRLRKFIKRDWSINAGQILKMCCQISELDLTDPKVLEDQLTGVDVSYFGQLQKQFVKDVESGKKRRTLREKAKAKVGDNLQLYTGMRHKSCWKIKDAVCIDAYPVELHDHGIHLGDGYTATKLSSEDSDTFAELDGFIDYKAMFRFLRELSRRSLYLSSSM